MSDEDSASRKKDRPMGETDSRRVDQMSDKGRNILKGRISMNDLSQGQKHKCLINGWETFEQCLNKLSKCQAIVGQRRSGKDLITCQKGLKWLTNVRSMAERVEN